MKKMRIARRGILSRRIVAGVMLDDYLYIFNIPGTESGTMPWPMFHRDAQHTGCVP